MFDAMPITSTRPKAIAGNFGFVGSPSPISFTPGAEIYAEGDKAGALYRVSFGVVRVYRLLADGRRQICAFHMPGEVFGFETDSERHFFADAVTAVGLTPLRSGSEVDLSRELLGLALKSLSRAHDHLLTLGRTDALGRVAGFLLEMAERQDVRGHGDIDLPMSRTDMADYLGLTIETVSRALTKLKDARVIHLVSARQVDVLRWEALEDMAG